MDFIVDSSVVAKWVLNEPGGEKARELIASHIFLRAPDLIISELANIFWKKAIRGDLTSEEAVERFDNILRDHIDVTDCSNPHFGAFRRQFRCCPQQRCI